MKTGYFLVAGHRHLDGDVVVSYVCAHPTRVVVASSNGTSNWAVHIDERIEIESPDSDEDIEAVLRRRATTYNAHLWWIKPNYNIRNPHFAQNIARALIEERMNARATFAAPALTDNDKRRLFHKGYQLLLGSKHSRLADLSEYNVLRRSVLPGPKSGPKRFR